MNRHPLEFRCDLCRRRVEDDLRARARRGWEPLIICDACLREAAEPAAPTGHALVLAPAAS